MENKKTASESTQLAQAPAKELNHSERFTAKVMATFGQNVGLIEANEYMRSLIQGYFIAIDRSLKMAEEARLRKKKNQDPVPVAWNTVNLNDLALDVMHYARIGLDMSMDNHLWPIPYKNNKTGLYDVTLMVGYGGVQYVAEKYAVDPPVAVTIELVYSNDTFIAIKKSRDNPIDTYTFDITQPFERGEIKGGFGYIEYADPKKNQLITMTRAQIEKRKPEYASPEFWGGEKDKWENGQKVGTVQVEGWFDEMCYKTLVREVYGSRHIPRDPRKIDDNYRYLKRRDAEAIEAAKRSDYPYADAEVIDITEPDAPQRALPGAFDPETGEIAPEDSRAGGADTQQQVIGMEF